MTATLADLAEHIERLSEPLRSKMIQLLFDLYELVILAAAYGDEALDDSR